MREGKIAPLLEITLPGKSTSTNPWEGYLELKGTKVQFSLELFDWILESEYKEEAAG